MVFQGRDSRINNKRRIRRIHKQSTAVVGRRTGTRIALKMISFEPSLPVVERQNDKRDNSGLDNGLRYSLGMV